MDLHEEFRELCAAAVAGELSAEEETRLAVHLAVCPECRRVKSEYEIAAVKGVAVLASGQEPKEDEVTDHSWSVDKAEEAFFRRLDKERGSNTAGYDFTAKVPGKRLKYRPTQIHWREIWMPFAAAILLALALGITAYRTGTKRDAEVARTSAQPAKESENSLEAQVSDVGHERAQLEAKLAENSKITEELKRQLAEQSKVVGSLKTADGARMHTVGNGRESVGAEGEAKTERNAELTDAQAKLVALQKTVDAAEAQRDQNGRQVAVLEAKVNELTQLVREREQALDQREMEVAKGQELLEHDRDIRELMGARDLYMADIRDVSGKGTDKTYGRVFYTKGKSLIFYAFDLDAQPGVQNASSFQAWGRKGPDKQKARNLGIFYEDNASKKRWVLKADDPKTLEDIDAVFVTVEPNGGSQHPSGKQLLFAYLRVTPNHP